MKAKSIAKAILADHRRERSERTDITKCFMCGYGMVYRGSRFCSDRCREYYVEGNPGHFQDWLQAKITYQWQDGRPMRAGQRGFHINCAHCRKEFESLGPRCCSVECERLHRDGVKIGKRRCTNCDVAIPTWRKGRRVSSKTRFCSPKCAKATSRVSDTREAVLSANT